MILFNDETGLIVFWVNLKIKKFKILKLKKIKFFNPVLTKTQKYNF